MCDAKIRPFSNDIEVECECIEKTPHDKHHGLLENYAYPGSETTIKWLESDRRNFHGEWPGYCTKIEGCTLPVNHPGDCALY